MITQLSTDHGATIYHDGISPDFEALQADDRIRKVYNRDDFTTGDYTYSEHSCALYLTDTGEKLWQWDGGTHMRP